MIVKKRLSRQMMPSSTENATLKTVEGEPLTLSENGKKLFINGKESGVAEVTISDVKQSNGVSKLSTPFFCQPDTISA